MPALRAASPAAIFLPARRPMNPLATIPGTIRMPHSTPKIHGLRSANSDASVRMAYWEPTPSEAIAAQSNVIVAVPATYMELRALSIVSWMSRQLSSGVSALASPSGSCIIHLPVFLRTVVWPDASPRLTLLPCGDTIVPQSSLYCKLIGVVQGGA